VGYPSVRDSAVSETCATACEMRMQLRCLGACVLMTSSRAARLYCIRLTMTEYQGCREVSSLPRSGFNMVNNRKYFADISITVFRLVARLNTKRLLARAMLSTRADRALSMLCDRTSALLPLACASTPWRLVAVPHVSLWMRNGRSASIWLCACAHRGFA